MADNLEVVERLRPCVVLHTHDSSTWEVLVGKSVQGHYQLHREFQAYALVDTISEKSSNKQTTLKYRKTGSIHQMIIVF